MASPATRSERPQGVLREAPAQAPARRVAAETLQAEEPIGGEPERPAPMAPFAASAGVEPLSPPPSFRDWREYVEDVEFNPARASLTNDEIDALRQILGRRTDRIRTLQEEAARHLGALVDIKVHQGDCQVVDRGAEIRPESGHMVALNISHDGLRRVVRVYPGDYAPLDLAYADMWTQYRLGQEEIKALLVQH